LPRHSNLDYQAVTAGLDPYRRQPTSRLPHLSRRQGGQPFAPHRRGQRWQLWLVARGPASSRRGAGGRTIHRVGMDFWTGL